MFKSTPRVFSSRGQRMPTPRRRWEHRCPRKHRCQWGFTAVEIGLLVAILAVLAVIGLAFYQQASRKGKETEAVVNLKRLFDGARTYYNRSRNTELGKKLKKLHFPSVEESQSKEGDFAVMPQGPPCSGGKAVYPDNPTQWADAREPWKALGFSIEGAHYHRYGFSSSLACKKSYLARGSPCFSIQAEADLNCDGVRSTVSMHAGFSEIKGDVKRGPILVHRAGE